MTDHVCWARIMDDSDQDFTDLCSRLLKRVRKKGPGSGDEKRSAAKDEEPSSPSSKRNPLKRRKKTRDASKTEINSKINGRTQTVTLETGDASQPVPKVSGTEKVKDVVIRRMQRFKRNSPERLQHAHTNQTTTELDGNCPTPAGIRHSGMLSNWGFQPTDPPSFLIS